MVTAKSDALQPTNDELLALLMVSASPLLLVRPLYDLNGEVTDFAVDYLNPAAQQALGEFEHPANTLLTYFSDARLAETLAFCSRALARGAATRVADDPLPIGPSLLAARRIGERLAVSFADPTDQARPAGKTTFYETPVAATRAQTEAENQRQYFYDVLMELPAQVATYHGPDHIFAFVNPRYQRYFPDQVLLGRSLHDVLPEAGEQGIIDRLDQVYQTGEPYRQQEVEVWLDFTRTGQRKQVFLDLFFYPLRDGQDRIIGVLDFSYDVTPQVRTRQQLKLLAEQLRMLNEELEHRIELRTIALRVQAAEARSARTDAEQQRANLVRFLSQTHAAICVLRGPTHVLDYCNPTFERLFSGRSLPSGRPLVEVFPGAVAQGLVPALNDVFTTGKSFFGVERALTIVPPADQEVGLHYFTFSFDAYWEYGRTVGVSIFAYDVTAAVLARRRNDDLQTEVLAAARQQLRQREAYYQVFEQTPALVALLRQSSHRFEYVNPAYQSLFPGRQLVGLDMGVAVSEVYKYDFIALLDQVYQTGQTHIGTEVPFAVAPAAGQPTQTEYYNFTYQPYCEDDHIVGISIFAFNVTPQVLARREREMHQQRLNELFEQAPVAIAVLRGPRYVFELANPFTCQLLGHPSDYLLGKGLFEALPETASRGFEQLLDQVMATGVPYVAHESPSKLERNGQVETVYWNYVYHPLREPDGTVTGIITVATDATDRVRARQQLAKVNLALSESNRQLTRTNIELDNFIYTASHDLKAPIANIEGLLHALLVELPESIRTIKTVGSLLVLIQQAVDRFQLTIDQLTDITRLQQAHTQPAEAVDLAALIESIRLDLQPVLTAADTQFTVAVVPGIPVFFSPRNLRSIIFNLLDNAVKYRRPDQPSVVQLRCSQTNSGLLLLEVEDNGIGLDKAQQAKLFGMFVRLHTHVPGTGIGLYMVKKIVENSGGTITVQSQPGTGSIFIVKLPNWAP